MSKTYQKKDAAVQYDAARGMPDETMALWADTLRGVVPPRSVSSVLDLGGGTGRFTGMLQQAYHCPVTVIDPSEEMLEQGRGRGLKNVSWFSAPAEDIPLPDGSIDLVWMCQVFHHLEDKKKAFNEIMRILTPDGCLALRNGTRENDEALKWMQLFPEAMALEAARIPYRAQIIETVCRCNFKLVSEQTVYQKFASSYEEYYEKISRRGLSVLIEISDEAFKVGLKRLRTWTDQQPDEPAYEPVDLFIFRKANK